MRVGLSWDLDTAGSAVQNVGRILAEAATAGRLGYDSAWVRESRDGPGACPHPGLVLTALARKDKTLQLRTVREVKQANPVRLAEEIAVLDVFSRGRAGLAFAAAGRQGEPPARVHETAEFVRAAWARDEFRFRGEHVRFPAHTPDDAPAGASEPARRGCTPQWEWGPVMPDFLAVTPKPHAPRPPLYVEIDDPGTLEWAAAHGVSPFVAATVATEDAVERLCRYREAARAAGRGPAETEVVCERVITTDGGGESDADRFGGDAASVVAAIKDFATRTGMRHLVWQRKGSGDADLFRFAVDVYPLLQT